MQSGAVARRAVSGSAGKSIARCALLLSTALFVACGGPDSAGDDAAAGHERDASADTSADGGASDAAPIMHHIDHDAGPSTGPARDAGRDRDAAPAADGGNSDPTGKDASLPDASAADTGAPDASDVDPHADGEVIAPPRPDLQSVKVGYNHACAIDAQHRLWCWGANSFGQLGVADRDERAAPVRVGAASDWTALALGRFHSCGLRAGGALYCWGASAYGQAGVLADAVLEPAVVPAPQGSWTAVASGDWHSCAITDGGAVYCWGYSLLGRLGDGTGSGADGDPEAFVSAPVAAVLPRAATAVSAGATHSCALDDQGAVYCWGGGERGQLGATAHDSCKISSESAPCNLTPRAIDAARHWVALSVGANHACAVDDAAGLWCWGAGEYGQLGAELQFSSAAIELDGEWDAVACGAYHTCALGSAANLGCFGDQVNGQLGSGSASSIVPVDTGAGRSWLAVSAGALGSCALDDQHDAYCWGQSAYAQAGVPALVRMP